MPDTDVDVRALQDRIEIQDLYARYTTGLNTLELDRLDTVFTPDAHIDASAFGVPAMSYADFKPFLAKAFEALRGHLYTTHNLSVELGDGKAEVRAAFTAWMGLAVGDDVHQLTEGGHYADRLVRTDEGWRVEHRVELPAFVWGMPEGFSVPE